MRLLPLYTVNTSRVFCCDLPVAALKMNEILVELFLADNRLMPSDGIQLGNLLKYNHKLQLLDIRNNHLQVRVSIGTE